MTQEEIKYHNRLWYYKTYNQLIDKCLQMEKEGYPEGMYTEVHHILPKCQGGTNRKCNLVRMPVRYHIVAHMLLACAFPDEKGLVYAVNIMFVGNNRKSEASNISTRLISKFKEEYFKKLSESSKGKNNVFYGKHHTEETKKKLSEISKDRYDSPDKNPFYGKHHTEESKKKMSEAKRGRKLSEEHKRKISLSGKGRKNSPSSIEKTKMGLQKPVLQLDMNNNVLNRFPRVKEAARILKYDPDLISKCCRGFRKDYKGFIWRFEKDYLSDKVHDFLNLYNIDLYSPIDLKYIIDNNYLGVSIISNNISEINRISKFIKEESDLLIEVITEVSIDSMDLEYIDFIKQENRLFEVMDDLSYINIVE